MSTGLEVEIKLPVADRREMEDRILGAGGEPTGPRTFEENWLFDFDDGRLKQREVMLRLRLAGAEATLTVKERTGDDSEYKVRRETETVVDDADAMRKMLQAVGLSPVYRYQKYRRSYRHGDLKILLDELPLGTYVELEGATEAIDAFAAQLGFGRDDYIRLSYRELQMQSLPDRDPDDSLPDLVFAGGSEP